MIGKSPLAGAVALVIFTASNSGHAAPFNNHQLLQSLFNQAHKVEVSSLAEAARQSRKLVGTALNENQLAAANQPYLDILLEQFDYLTPENSAKWGSLQSTDPNSWNFTTLDSVAAFAASNDKLVKGHALVWHSQAPAFINDELSAADLQAAIDTHIATTVGRYKGQFHAWDVVNEAIGDDAQFRDTVFYRTLGEDYIADAFHAADAADRRAKLFYNDYNIDGFNAKSDKVYELMADLVDADVPVDGIGFQMHLTASGAPGYDELLANMERFADLGLEINISELDVRIADLPWDQATNLALQRQVYHRVASACHTLKECEALTTWGFTDAYSWVDSTFGEDDPLLYDEQYNRKPAWYGLLDGLMGVAPDALGTMPNLIANSHFEAGADGWTGTGATVSRLFRKSRVYDGSSALSVTARTSPDSGASYSVTDVVASGRSYTAAAQVYNDNQRQADVELELYYRCDDDSEAVINIDSQNIKRRTWTGLQGEVTLPECNLDAVELRINGANANVNLLIDAVSLRPTTLIPDDTGFGPNIVRNPTFEVDSSWWYGFGDAVVTTTADQANTGNRSGAVSNRTANWQGPATSLFEGATAGAQYQLLGYVRMAEGAAQVNATLATSCANGDQFNFITSAQANDAGWTPITGTFTVPDCDQTNVVLYFEGPAADVDFYIDDIYVREISPPLPGDNLLSNGDFEAGLTGWVAWGGTLELSTTEANSGTQSAWLHDRTADWQGPVWNLLSAVVPGGTYNISGFSKIAGLASADMYITLKTTCADSTEAYNFGGAATVNDTSWTQVSGSVTLPDCPLTEASLYFSNPPAEADIYLDDVVVTVGN